MSEKRYTFECNDNNCLIFEDGVWLKIEEVVDLLNEQQATINKQSDEISYWEHRISSLLWILHKFEEQETIKSLIEEIDRDDFNLELKWWEEIYEQQTIIQKQNNEIKKLKSLLEFSNEQYGQKLLVELRFENEWKADVNVIDEE